ncbi:tRNA (adenosine(37)-N6)-dimethylallyltransferase MiaA [Saccharicrinis sp. FJH2]|uniref:tRNA (adenosine(37)-N6)-dimethylallyltransferase MiaA n=1 Tax=unclassified Saccharicrinis TaxID=2646859 RepID=UPI0035D50423
MNKNPDSTYNLLTVIGPTASGKTGFAVALAKELNAEIISGDSRQLYRGMDIGTGKDLVEYSLDGTTIPYHLIDIVDAGYKYNVYEYQRDFVSAFEDISGREKLPLLCGGTGLYIEAVLKGYKLVNVPQNPKLRSALEQKTLHELEDILKSYKSLHNSTDTDTKRRAIRAIEIAEYYSTNQIDDTDYPEINSLLIGVSINRELRRKKITARLKTRLEEGMIDEVKALLEKGITPEDLIYYGLEYKFVTQYLIGELTYDEMFESLEIAIHQFAKRQMTWFRGMERRGFKIHWIDVNQPLNEKIEKVKSLFYGTVR